MTPAWAQRREALLSDCLVSPDVFHGIVSIPLFLRTSG
jgi:hypothetical protein